ncbi:DUF6879 family protein [Nocardiopsis algeriensis]|uniref:DUF6879 domain-containing protein n=1 Tax=Nocardiopsis algeriensis TaxID=1478215 RepID=A0A841IL47_9ACTN|nr:DUF6879 family protein [Nocardiopsis algeriensis]MBB6119457.1 hypothetical protein [Nocardiopsis algeriensis]
MGRFLSEEEFSAQFSGFERSAWKLEVRDRYNVPEEAETLHRFLDTGDLGRSKDHARTSPWHRNVTATTRQGKVWQRVRVVSEPLSGYIAWEHAVTRFNIEAGEDIRWLPRSHPSVAELPDLDFWLFDDSWVCVLHFDSDDVPRELERIDGTDEVAPYLRWRDIAWKHAVPHNEFAPQVPGWFDN